MIEEKTILLVDDDAILCCDQARILKQEGYQVVTAMSGKAALDKFNNGNKIDLILMDIDLGKGMDGTQVAEIILRDHPIPLIFLSGHTEVEIIHKTEKITSYGFVLKGSGPDILSMAMKTAFKLHFLHMENLRYAESLKDSELRYRRLFESAQDGILILNAEYGNIIDVNPYLAELIGYDHSEILGKFLWEISPLKDITENKEKFLELQKKEYVHYEHLPLMNKNGTVKNVEFVSNVYWVNQDRIIQCNIRDIEKRKKIENGKEAMLKEKVIMLRELQHRIKNSMAVITSLLNFESERSPDAAVKAAFHRIRDRIGSMANLYGILNSFEDMNEVQLDQYFNAMLDELFRSYVNSHRKIILDLKLEKIVIDVDMALPIGLILNELVTNSLKYAFPDDRSGSVRVSLKRDQNEGVLEVSDDGVGVSGGIPADDSKHLGLSLVKMLAEQVGGGFKQAPVDQGALFRIRFPLVNIAD
jgi:PAS domain S-box-containing protein